MFRLLLLISLSSFALSNQYYHENLADDLALNPDMNFYILNGNGDRFSVEKAKLDASGAISVNYVSGTTIKVMTGKIKFQKYPKKNITASNVDPHCVGKWRLANGSTGWLDKVSPPSTPSNLGVSQITSPNCGCNGCTTTCTAITRESTKKIGRNCYIWDQYGGSTTASQVLYSFETSSAPTPLSIGKSSTFAAKMATNDVFFDTTLSASTACLQDLWVSPRLAIFKQLYCPTALFEPDGTMTWHAYKYNDVWGYQFVANTNSYDGNFLYFSEGDSQSYMLHDTFINAIDAATFNGTSVSRLKNFLYTNDFSSASGQVCQKAICPKYYTQSASNPNICEQRLKRITVNPIPKKIYVAYPNGGISGTYKVPDLDAYFRKAINALTYEVTSGPGLIVSLNGTELSISVDTSNTSVNDIVASASGKYSSFITIMAKESLDDPSSTPQYDFPNRELALEVRIEVDILSSIYQPQEQQLYRCQALTQ